MAMKTSTAGLDLIKRWEGCRLKAYQDSVGVWTIGYGLTSAAGIVPVTAGMTITQRQADAYLVEALAKYEAAVLKALTRTPGQPQFDAMVSLCYNIGPGAFAGSTLVRRFNAGDIAGAADAFLMWNKAGGRVLKGLENRRKDERTMFLLPARTAPAASVAPEKPSPAPTPPPAPETPPAASAPPPDAGRNIAAIVLGAAGALIAALAAWIIGG
jgi:GH24 family phage-related lysozyme (muramidase)